jgi:hypothetical protein
MTQPTIINAGDDNTTKDTTAYDPAADSGDSRTFNSVTIPASANTVCFLFIADVPHTTVNVSGISATGGGVEIFDFQVSPNDSSYRSARAMAMDVSSLGAFSSTVTVSLSTATTVGSILGVICTDGFIENVTSTVDKAIDSPLYRSFSKNSDNNIFCSMTAVDGDFTSALTISSGTELFNATDSKASGTGVYAISQATSSADVKTIAYSSSASQDSFDVQYVFSTQRNPFATSFGPVIRPIISHDVIS